MTFTRQSLTLQIVPTKEKTGEAIPKSERVSATAKVRTHKPNPTLQHLKLAKLMLHDGKPFKHAAIESGFGKGTASQGAKQLCETTPSFAAALEQTARTLPDSQELLALSVHTLVQDIRAGRSRGLEKTIETLGKFKHHDWFVRNSDMSMGIFLALGEQPPEQALSDELDKYHE